MRLSPASFNRLLNHLGQSFSWRKGYACPCVDMHSGAASLSCTQCLGKGRIWGSANAGSAGIVSREKMRNYAAFGVWDSDDIMLSIPSDSPLYAMGQYDRVAALDRSEPFSLNIIKGFNDVLNFHVLSLDRAIWFSGGDIIEGAIPFVSENGIISWPNGVVPGSGVTFSLTGRRMPEYFCYLEIPTDRPMHHGEPLPRRVVLRRFELFDR